LEKNLTVARAKSAILVSHSAGNNSFTATRTQFKHKIGKQVGSFHFPQFDSAAWLTVASF
jgi:hypothetical protein